MSSPCRFVSTVLSIDPKSERVKVSVVIFLLLPIARAVSMDLEEFGRVSFQMRPLPIARGANGMFQNGTNSNKK